MDGILYTGIPTSCYCVMRAGRGCNTRFRLLVLAACNKRIENGAGKHLIPTQDNTLEVSKLPKLPQMENFRTVLKLVGPCHFAEGGLWPEQCVVLKDKHLASWPGQTRHQARVAADGGSLQCCGGSLLAKKIQGMPAVVP